MSKPYTDRKIIFLFLHICFINHFVRLSFLSWWECDTRSKSEPSNITAHKKGAKCIHARLNFGKSILSLWLRYPIWFWYDPWWSKPLATSLQRLVRVLWMLIGLQFFIVKNWKACNWYLILNSIIQKKICTSLTSNQSQMST